MKDFKFDSQETKDYYLQSLRKYRVGFSNWDSAKTITREDVENYIKDAENILQC
jgi:gamma-glutamylcysteine synthetase